MNLAAPRFWGQISPLYYLHDEPVQAGPPSAAYRFCKFARRNKAAMLVTAVIAASLIVATTVSVCKQRSRETR